MGSLVRFRPAQFSEEEVAWLPPWLQPSQVLPQRFEVEDMKLFQQSSSTTRRKCGKTSSIDDGRYKSCHLFLSMEDNSPITSFSSYSNKVQSQVLQFHLHLPFDGDFENSFGPLRDNSQAEKFRTNHPLPMQELQLSDIPNEKINSSEVNYENGDEYLVPNSRRKKSKLLGCKSLDINEDYKTKPEVHARVLKDTDVSDAVELLIGASEALIIHEVVNYGPTTELWPASAVLEAALKLKWARVDGFEETDNCSLDGNSEIDYLLDLDESIMADAYEDVGLTFDGEVHTCGYASLVSQVKDSYAFLVSQVKDNYPSVVSQVKDSYDSLLSQAKCSYATDSYSFHGKQKCQKPGVIVAVSDDISTKQHSKDVVKVDTQMRRCLVQESFEHGRYMQHIDNAAIDLENNNESCDVDSMFNFSAKGYNLITTEVNFQNVNFVLGDVISSQATVRRASLHENDDFMKNAVPERFQSRWFGGWTWKDECNVAANSHKRMIHISKPFVGETSFLSESADIAPDENSFVQEHDKNSQKFSQSSLDAEFIHNKANEGIVLSKDDKIYPSQSFFDPLSSFLPCSIPSENAYHAVEQLNAEKCLSPATEAVTDSLKRTSIMFNEFIHGGEEASPKVTAGGSPTIHRHATLLRYSMLTPRESAYLDKKTTHGLSPMQGNLNFLSSFRKFPTTDLAHKANNCPEKESSEAELPIHMQEDTYSPIVEVSKCFSLYTSEEENLQQTLGVEKYVELQQSKSFQKMQSNCRNSPGPGRKRVCFTKDEVGVPQVKRHKRLQTSDKNCSIPRSVKMLMKSSNLQPQCKAHERKRYPKKRMLFRNVYFLLTGFSLKKEKKIEDMIKKNGGIVLYDIPSPHIASRKRGSCIDSQPFPIILCVRKLQTTKFLYGCAVNACILKVKWVTDSIAAGSILSPDKYMILHRPANQNCTEGIGKLTYCSNLIFDHLGIMLHGNQHFCMKMAKVIKHGGGLLFKTLHWLVQSLDAGKVRMAAIVIEDERRVCRQLKKCAAEQNIPMMPMDWIINSLYAGKIVSSTGNKLLPLIPLELPDNPFSMELSVEI